MKVDMSPKAIEDRLKLVGELTKACLLIRHHSLRTKPQKDSKNVKTSISTNFLKRRTSRVK